MGWLRVVSPGAWTTVQDLGREGWSDLGVAASGAADPLSLRVGNRIVGNEDAAAALEMTLAGAVVAFDDDAVIALTGAPMRATVEGPNVGTRPLPPWDAAPIRAGEVVRIGGAARGARSYLCVAGGIDVAPVLGSRSTHVASGLGGAGGRPLRAGDRLPIGETRSSGIARRLDPGARAFVEDEIGRRALRALDGSHAGAFEGAPASRFWGSEFTVTVRADRVGIRLEGPDVSPRGGGRMLTEGMPLGAVQVPDAGRPIVLLADRPVTGGYPVIACLATVDLPAAGQLRPRDGVRFERVTPDEARRLLAARERRLSIEVPAP